MIAPVAVTLGDPAGVGAEITLKAWDALKEEVPFFLIADLTLMHSVAARLERSIKPIDTARDAAAVGGQGLMVLPHPLPAPVTPGVATPENAASTIENIARAVQMAITGQASAVVTNPINKKALKDGAAFAFPGHTEYLAHLSGVARSVMMLSAPELRVVPVTIHIPLADASARLTPDLLETTLRITHAAMKTDFGLNTPRIAVAGLNPHAGEGGTMGREEIEVITPVLNRLRAEGMNLAGPLSADTMFHPAARENYDIAVCMYHDQALIPIKTLNFAAGVNTTLGLPFVRTSPDHGTAYDIAGKGIADPSSLIEAIRLAYRIASTRAAAT